MKWTGVMPAITTCFNEAYQVDHEFIGEHAGWLVANGCTGIVALGSLGEECLERVERCLMSEQAPEQRFGSLRRERVEPDLRGVGRLLPVGLILRAIRGEQGEAPCR